MKIVIVFKASHNKLNCISLFAARSIGDVLVSNRPDEGDTRVLSDGQKRSGRF